MAPVTTTSQLSLSPAELAYLHASLNQLPPIRPDGRVPTQFRPLVAESDVLPNANGSARVCFSDGTEAVVGVKAEVERTVGVGVVGGADEDGDGEDDDGDGGESDGRRQRQRRQHGSGQESWLEMSVDMPGLRDDDGLPVFLTAMLTEALLAGGSLVDRLRINSRFHWKLYVDILVLSQPLSFPLPLLSLTTHLALLSSRLPRLISEGQEDPLFDDDWAAAVPLYPRQSPERPPVTLLVMTVGQNIIFDPSREELAVADGVLAVSVSVTDTSPTSSLPSSSSKTDLSPASGIRLLAVRTVDPPSRLTPAGIPNSINSATGGAAPASNAALVLQREACPPDEGVWRPPRGGIKRDAISRVIKMVLERGGVAEEVMEALNGVET